MSPILRTAPRAALACLALILATTFLAIMGTTVAPGAALIGYAALFIPYVALLWRREFEPHVFLWLILPTAILVRLVLIPAEPLFSDDIYRYVWDGRVAAAGINPFMYAPAADALFGLRDDAIWPLINHGHIPTIYPPVAQVVFQVNAVLGGGTALLKLFFVLIEAAGVLACYKILARARGFNKAKLSFAFAVYALNPLVFVEVAWSGHVDVVAWTPLLAGLLLFTTRTGLRAAVLAGVLLGVSISAKFLGLLAIPLLVCGRRLHRELPLRRELLRRALLVAAIPIVVAASYLPYVDAGERLFAGLGTYSTTWRANDGGFRAIHALTVQSLERNEPEDGIFRLTELDPLFLAIGWTKTWEGELLAATSFTTDELAGHIAKIVGAFIMLLALLWCLWRGPDPLRSLLALLLVLFFVAPTVHPWYVAWLIPLAALRFSPAALTFSAIVLLAYLAWLSDIAGGPWTIPWWAAALQYGAVVAVAMATRASQVSSAARSNAAR